MEQWTQLYQMILIPIWIWVIQVNASSTLSELPLALTSLSFLFIEIFYDSFVVLLPSPSTVQYNQQLLVSFTNVSFCFHGCFSKQKRHQEFTSLPSMNSTQFFSPILALLYHHLIGFTSYSKSIVVCTFNYW